MRDFRAGAQDLQPSTTIPVAHFAVATACPSSETPWTKRCSNSRLLRMSLSRTGRHLGHQALVLAGHLSYRLPLHHVKSSATPYASGRPSSPGTPTSTADLSPVSSEAA
ncbi:hypothetical protein BD410DRAFT_403250 [Rickenella mellea]|uniref:Uncharacterized protein n=1 Tax=Rickenella mellea TaxID=50990 RepID=A0A4Y7PXV2_9AGAM|nr:hypothetical protein BD410DRAFT_403250 [Rickenella mellea]